MLTVNPRDARTIALVALCEAKLGRRLEAERHAAEALAIGATDRDVLFRKAEVHAVLHQLPQALAALERAIERGYQPSFARDSDDLAVLRRLPAFQALITRGAER
jgi:tetratricopeptide (TPR) repeat protein